MLISFSHFKPHLDELVMIDGLLLMNLNPFRQSLQGNSHGKQRPIDSSALQL